MRADLALQQLLEGNRRFIEFKQIHPNQDKICRDKLITEQKPIAVVVGCYDSRVSPEIIFDQGLGDLFVLRTAGHVLNNHMIGGIEYAIKYMGVSLIMVLGHENCAAVDTAIKNILTDTHLDDISVKIRHNVGKIDTNQPDYLTDAAKRNVSAVIDQILNASDLISDKIDKEEIKILGAYYYLNNGTVEIIT